MNNELLDVLYNHKAICETLLKSGYSAAAAIFYEKAACLSNIPGKELSLQRRIFLNSLNKSIYNFILYVWDISLAQCCYNNLIDSHYNFKDEKHFLTSGEKILKNYAQFICTNCPKASHVEHACNYIDSHLCEELSLELVARRVYVSKTYLSQMFKERTGHSFTEYVNNQRIVKARRLLLTTDLKIDQIAESCGFFSSTYFSTAFKKNTGMTPRAFRQRYHSASRYDRAMVQ
ncbi:MAG: helix-turn-helix transcriptional regulator [Clostridiales bacterium]|nr:helix-turn-helix transcriptional regulator [Clostridiales bacterium]